MSISFSAKGADRILKRIKNLQNNLPSKIDELLEKLTILGAFRARVDYSNAMYAGDNDVEVFVEPITNGYKIIAQGAAVLFIEFGTGVINPEHPLSDKFGYAHGEYGKGKGANPKGWVYKGVQGNAGQTIRDGVYHTMGNPPARAMYNASVDMEQEIKRIAKEVFSRG